RKMEAGQWLPNEDAPGLGTLQATATFHSARLRMLSGDAKLLRPSGAGGTKTKPLFEGAKPGQEWDGNGLKMKFCWCPAGQFAMGSPVGQKARDDDEGQVSVMLSRGLWLGKYEVTQGEGERSMGRTLKQQATIGYSTERLSGYGA